MLRSPLPSQQKASSTEATSDEANVFDQGQHQQQQHRRRRRQRHQEPSPSTVQSFTSNDYESVHYLNDDENVNMNANRKSTPSSSAQPSTLADDVEETMPLTSSSPPLSLNEFNQNELFEGFCIDILRLIAEMVGFEYNIKLVPDGKYGVYDLETGEWNGIVRELMDKVSTSGKDQIIKFYRFCNSREKSTCSLARRHRKHLMVHESEARL